jgi:hypothetical protein
LVGTLWSRPLLIAVIVVVVVVVDHLVVARSGMRGRFLVRVAYAA